MKNLVVENFSLWSEKETQMWEKQEGSSFIGFQCRKKEDNGPPRISNNAYLQGATSISFNCQGKDDDCLPVCHSL